MPTIPKRPHFFETEAGQDIEEVLKQMVSDPGFNTESTYIADGLKYPDHLISFIQKHKMYLIANPGVDPRQYVANLRLKTRLSRR